MSEPANNSAIRVSVIVPHFNQLDALKLCLTALESQTLPREQYEIIVADNNSDSDVKHAASQFPDVKFLTVREQGAALARNAGMEIARGEVLAFTDADCVPASDWLEQGVEALADANFVGGRVSVTIEREGAPSPVEAFETVFAFNQRKYVKVKKFSVTANLFAARKAAEAVGPFHNGVSEDVDWCHRAAALGFRLAFNDKSIVSHPARRTWNELVSKWDRMVRERWNGFGGRRSSRGVSSETLHWTRTVAWAGLAIATALSAAPHLLVVLTSTKLNSVRDRIAAAGVLARIRWWRAKRMVALLYAEG